MKLRKLLSVLIGYLIVTFSINYAQQSIRLTANCNIKPSEKESVHYLKPPHNFFKQIKTSQFEITFVNSTTEMEEAVRYAADIWSSILVSDVTIKVLVTFYPMTDFLGQCVSNLIKDFPDAPMENTWYVSSLADAVTGVEQQPGKYDMDIFLTSSAPWYFGLDGNCPSNKFDMVDVALHEMGHGLGYFGLGFINNGEGSYGHIPSSALTRPIVFPFPDLEGMPTNYDKHIMTSGNQFLADTTNFPNPSESLADLFTSDDLFFSGEYSNTANGNTPVKIFASSTFHFASSLLHLDEDTYPAGNPSTLMTPYVGYGEANHNPGPVTIGLFKDLGWEINDSLTVSIEEGEIIPGSFTLKQNYPNPFNPSTMIEFGVPGLTVSQSVFLNVYNSLGQHIVTLVKENKAPGLYQVEFNASHLSGGVYFYTLEVEGKLVNSRKMVLIK